MQKKWLGILLIAVCMISVVLIGCNRNADTGLGIDQGISSNIDLNKERQISSKDFNEAMEAYKEFYDTFHEEHRFNGSYEDSWDCFANIYMVGGRPIMAAMDILTVGDYSFTNKYGNQDYSNVATFDLYLYEYNGREVQEVAKYTNLQTSDEEVYLFPMQDKLFMSYYDEERELTTVELGEYCTELDKKYYKIYCDDMDYESHDAEFIENACKDWLDCDSFNEVAIENDYYDTYELQDSRAAVFLNTGLGETGNDGTHLMYAYMRCGLANYQLITDSLFDEDLTKCLYADNFKKYLDYLMEQEITNNIDLRICHSEYFAGITEEKEERLRVLIWLDGVYYIVEENVAYVYAFDYGHTEEDVPKDLCGYEISDQYWIDVHPDDNSVIVSIKHRLDLHAVWEQVQIAKEEYEKSAGAAIKAYEEYLYDTDYYYGYVYALIYIDDDDIPELYINSESSPGGIEALLTYSEGQVIYKDVSTDDIFRYYERQGVFYTEYHHMDRSAIGIYKLQDGEFQTIAEGYGGMDENWEYKYYHVGDKIFSDEEEEEFFNYMQSFCPEGSFRSVGYIHQGSSLAEACEKAGIAY